VKLAHPEMMIISLDAWWNILGSLLPKDFFEVYRGLGHGSEGEMSIALAVSPELCKPENARGTVPDLPSLVDVKWNFPNSPEPGNEGIRQKRREKKGLVMKKILTEAILDVIKKTRRDRMGLPVR
jgi:creatinine amidohydrolase